MSELLQRWEKIWRWRPDVPAILEPGGRSCTFGELERRAEAWAARHASHPACRHREAVIFAVPNGSDWMEIFLGLAKAGAVAVPLDAAEPAAAQHEMARAIRAGARWNGGELESLTGGRRFRSPDTCLIKLTSGTTGRPRPLVFTDAQMLADARQVTATMGIRATDLNYALIPFGHSYGLGNLTFPLVGFGVPVACGSGPLPHVIAHDFARWRPTVFPSVPAVFRALVAADLPADALASLRVAISAGAPLSPDTARDFAARFGRRIHAFYGSSETGGIAYDRSGAAALAGGVGRPMRDVRIQLLPRHRIEVCSAAVFTHGNPRRKDRVGCWMPADRVRSDAGGQLTLLGRRGRTVKIGGRRLNLGEVAARLRRLDGVDEVWVGVNRAAEPVLGAAVISARRATDLRAELLADTATWKVPRKLAVLGEFPLTARGKTDTRALEQIVFR